MKPTSFLHCASPAPELTFEGAPSSWLCFRDADLPRNSWSLYRPFGLVPRTPRFHCVQAPYLSVSPNPPGLNQTVSVVISCARATHRYRFVASHNGSAPGYVGSFRSDGYGMISFHMSPHRHTGGWNMRLYDGSRVSASRTVTVGIFAAR